MSKIKFRVASANIFADLGIPQPEEALAKADLARQLISIINERGLTQTEAAQLLGIDQPKVSALTRGQLGGFSMERLMNLLVVAGKGVEVLVHEPVHPCPTKVHVFGSRSSRRWLEPEAAPSFADMVLNAAASSAATVGFISAAMILNDSDGLNVGCWLNEDCYTTRTIPSQESARMFAYHTNG
jgi:predicted XRE-type DNA-binding protein